MITTFLAAAFLFVIPLILLLTRNVIYGVFNINNKTHNRSTNLTKSKSFTTLDSSISKIPKFKVGQKINVAFLIYNHVEALDLNGPLDIFSKANDMDDVYNLYTVSPTDEPIYSEGNVMSIQATYSISNAPQADILIIPGARFDIVKKIRDNAEIINWIQKQNTASEITMSVCTGALILSTAGILDGKSATTHFMANDVLKANSNINVLENLRYVHDGKIITTAGVTSGFDGALHLIDLINGKKIADQICKMIIYDRNGDLSFMEKL